MYESLVSRLLAHASSHPGDLAIVDGRWRVTCGELDRRILAAASRLDAMGVRSGGTVALCLCAGAECADWLCAFYGAEYIGATVLPLYPDVPQAGRQELVRAFGTRWS